MIQSLMEFQHIFYVNHCLNLFLFDKYFVILISYIWFNKKLINIGIKIFFMFKHIIIMIKIYNLLKKKRKIGDFLNIYIINIA